MSRTEILGRTGFLNALENISRTMGWVMTAGEFGARIEAAMAAAR